MLDTTPQPLRGAAPQSACDDVVQPVSRPLPKTQLIAVGSYGVGLIARFSRALGPRVESVAIDRHITAANRRLTSVIQLPIEANGGLDEPSAMQVRESLCACSEAVLSVVAGTRVAVVIAALGHSIPDIVTPWLAQLCQERGVWAQAVVVLPPTFMSRRKAERARVALEELRGVADVALAIDAEADAIAADMTLDEYSRLVEDRLLLAVATLADVVPRPSLDQAASVNR